MPALVSRIFVVSLLSAFVAACSTRTQVISYPEHYDASIAHMQRYCWADDRMLGEKDHHGNPIEKTDPTGGHPVHLDSMVHAEIDARLQKKNYLKTACDQADFHIDYRMNIHEDVVAADIYNSDPEHPTANPHQFKWKIGDRGTTSYEGLSGPEEQIITVRHGTIHIGAFLANHRLAWHSSAEKKLDDRDSDETRQQHVKHAIRKVMEGFPEYQPKQ